MRPRHTPADSARALEHLRLLTQRTPRERAEERMRCAKRAMSEAAQALLDRRPDAAELADRARADLEAARGDLQRLGSCSPQRAAS